MKTKSGFSWGNFLRNLAVIAIPVALQNLLTTTGSMVDTMMIAPLGETSVGAVGLCAQFSSLMFSGYWGFVGGHVPAILGRETRTASTAPQSDAGLYASTSIFTGLALLAPELVMRIYTDKTAIQAIGVDYLRIVGFAYPMQVISMAMSALLRSTERVRIPLFAAIASVATNMGLNWVFIYGKFGLPAMGVRGAALATTCAAAVNMAVILILSRAQGYPYLFHFSKHYRWNSSFVRSYFVKCFPILCNEILIGVGNMVINIVLGRQSEQAIAAIAVFRTLEGLVIGFFSGFSNAASVLVGKSVGAGELDTAYERAKRLVLLCGCSIFMLCVTLIAVHRPLLTVMSLSGESLEIGTGLLMIYSVAAVIRMCNWTQNDTYRSAGDAAYGTILEISFMYAVVLPCVCLTGLVWKAPFLLVFACCYIDEPIRFVLMQVHMYSGKWVRPVTELGRAALPAFRKKHVRDKAQRTA
ncbi:MAG: MATE family efflux transporter [Eubacteriales bacterium]